MKIINDKEFKEQVEVLRGLWDSTKEGAMKTGRQIIEMEKRWPDAVQRIAREIPELDVARLETLKRIGSGDLRWEIFVHPCPAAKRIAPMGIDKQNKIWDGLITVVKRVDGTFKREHKRAPELTSKESALAINCKDTNPPEVQEKMLLEQEARRIKNKDDYNRKEDLVFFTNKKRGWTREQLLDIADTLKPEISELESTIKKNQISGGLNPELSKIR